MLAQETQSDKTVFGIAKMFLFLQRSVLFRFFKANMLSSRPPVVSKAPLQRSNAGVRQPLQHCEHALSFVQHRTLCLKTVTCISIMTYIGFKSAILFGLPHPVIQLAVSITKKRFFKSYLSLSNSRSVGTCSNGKISNFSCHFEIQF